MSTSWMQMTKRRCSMVIAHVCRSDNICGWRTLGAQLHMLDSDVAAE